MKKYSIFLIEDENGENWAVSAESAGEAHVVLTKEAERLNFENDFRFRILLLKKTKPKKVDLNMMMQTPLDDIFGFVNNVRDLKTIFHANKNNYNIHKCILNYEVYSKQENHSEYGLTTSLS